MDETIPKADITELLPPFSVSVIQEMGFSADHNPADHLGNSYTFYRLTDHNGTFMTVTGRVESRRLNEKDTTEIAKLFDELLKFCHILAFKFFWNLG